MLYERFKKICLDYKTEIFTGFCFVLVFLAGFGSGSFVQPKATKTTQSYYTVNATKKQTNPPAEDGGVATPTPVVTAVDSASSSPTSGCIVKGNISSSGKKIYHVKGGAFYKTVKPEKCFNTEAEAKAAGFVKSKR